MRVVRKQVSLPRIPASFRMLAQTASLALLEGCVVGPRYIAPVTQAPSAFKEAAPQQSADGHHMDARNAAGRHLARQLVGALPGA
jgi:hypothetical protein